MKDWGAVTLKIDGQVHSFGCNMLALKPSTDEICLIGVSGEKTALGLFKRTMNLSQIITVNFSSDVSLPVGVASGKSLYGKNRYRSWSSRESSRTGRMVLIGKGVPGFVHDPSSDSVLLDYLQESYKCCKKLTLDSMPQVRSKLIAGGYANPCNCFGCSPWLLYAGESALREVTR